MKKYLAIPICLLALLLAPGCSDDTDDTLASSTADPPCSDDTGNRFVDCGNGTVTDRETGRVWLKDAECLGWLEWDAAVSAVAGLRDGQCGLTDNSRPGDWRLPRVLCNEGTQCPFTNDLSDGEFKELLTADCTRPFIANTKGDGCWAEGDPFFNIQPDVYWSSIESLDYPNNAWRLSLHSGEVSLRDKQNADYVWPVR